MRLYKVKLAHILVIKRFNFIYLVYLLWNEKYKAGYLVFSHKHNLVERAVS